MPKEVLCPICGASYNLADEQLGKKVRCKKCEHAFTAGGEPRRREDDDEEDDDGIQDAPRGKSKAKKGGRGRDEEYDDRPKKTKSVEEQAKPAGQRDPGLPVSSFVIMGIVVGVLVLCCGGGGLVYWAMPKNPPAGAPVRPNNPPPNRPPPNRPPNRRGEVRPPHDPRLAASGTRALVSTSARVPLAAKQ
ncbi:MAG TPA: zinc-ribbon domain-containing protein [Gemmataceae bacterium]|nr:zinc-ribbon domain-containing protein [Gemmataceae bacterium]